MLAFNFNIVGGNVISTRIGKCRKPNSQSYVECYPIITESNHNIDQQSSSNCKSFPRSCETISLFLKTA